MRTALTRLSVLTLIAMAAAALVLHLDSTTAAPFHAPLMTPLSGRPYSPIPCHAGRLETPIPLESGPRTSFSVVAGLQQRGFSAIQLLRWRGNSLLCEATGPRRERLRLVVDTTTGEVTGLQVLERIEDDVLSGP